VTAVPSPPPPQRCRTSANQVSVTVTNRVPRCRTGGVHGTSGSMCTGLAFVMNTLPVPHVAGHLAVAPLLPDRRCRSGPWGRGRERPGGFDAQCGHRGGRGCAHPTPPPPGRSRTNSPLREGQSADRGVLVGNQSPKPPAGQPRSPRAWNEGSAKDGLDVSAISGRWAGV